MALDELDGVTIAPDIHRVVFENDVVRVLEITIRAGDDDAAAHPPRTDRDLPDLRLGLHPA